MGSFIKEVPCTITIATDDDLSAGVYLGAEWTLIGIKYPGAWTAAGIAFQTSFDGVTYDVLKDDSGTELTKTVTAGEKRELDSSEFKTAIYLKIRSGTESVPVSQAANRTFTLYCRRYLPR